jgi:hydroxymethylpyrimidine/phosphomethylpyrimidine kinase
LATLVTPNLGEAEILLGKELKSLEDFRWAAREMHRRFGCAAVIKGGHLKGFNQAADLFFDGNTELLLTAPRIRGVKLHGTGCTFSAAITAHLAHGRSLPEAVTRAKQFTTTAIVNNHALRASSRGEK